MTVLPITPLRDLAHAQSLLPPDLQDHLLVRERIGPWFRHPFVNGPVPSADRLADIPAAVAAKRAIYKEHVAAGDYAAALFVVERPFRPDFLLELMGALGVDPLLPAVGFAWCDTEAGFAWQWDDIWWRVTYSGDDLRPNRLDVMTAEDRATYDALPETFIVYRGFSREGGEAGRSWTLDRAKAEWFAQRVAGPDEPPRVATMEIHKSAALAYFSDRGEAEIVLDDFCIADDAPFAEIEEIEDEAEAA